MNCTICKNEIPVSRIKILPNTKTCVKCSETSKVFGFPIISGKNTYSELQIVSEETAQELFKKQERNGGVGAGVQFKELPPSKLNNFE